jgi:zinc transporter 9
MSLTQSQLRLISTIGMGVLVGTSLIVIIPEGIEAVYTAGTVNHAHGKRGFNIARGVNVQWAHNARPLRRNVAMNSNHFEARTTTTAQKTDAFNALPGPVIPDVVLPAVDTHNPKSDPSTTKVSDTTHVSDEDKGHAEPPTFSVGLSLILGFALMFLIDKLPRHASENLAALAPVRTISLGNLSQGLHQPSESAGEDESEGFLQSLTPNPKQTRSLATTTGLVIHAAADGIAMGASASGSNTKLGFIIFIAIMIHKAPAAFGLTSVLLKQGLSKRAARGHLIIFSLAAPFGALTTWLIVHILGGGGSVDGEQGQWWTGMLLLFSAGTFL